MRGTRRRIVLAVTSAQSLRLLDGFPSYLAEQGWDVHVVSSDLPPGRPTGWAAHRLPMRREPSPLFDLVSLGRWVKLLVVLRPDLVVAGTPKAGLLGMLAAALTRTPRRIYLLRGLRLSTETGPRRRVLELLERVAITTATEVQSVSHSLREEVVNLGLAPPQKVTVVANGSSNGVVLPADDELQVTAARRRAELGLPERPTIGFVGRMHADKGIATLLSAFAEAATHSEIQLLLIGPEEPPGYLQEPLGELNESVRDHVTWLGRIDEPAPYYRAMDVLTLPSRREGYPNVVLEAAAHGVPTIAWDVTGCRDAVVDGSTGLLLPYGDDRALATAIIGAIAASDRTRAMGARARERAARDYERRKVWSQLDSYYRSATTKHAGDAT